MTRPGLARSGTRLGLAIALLLLSTVAARARPGDRVSTKTAADAQALAARIDERLLKHWKASKVQPAPAADDAEFLRRVYLDLIGRIPSAGEARHFLADKASDKRQRLVESLLRSPRYVTHWMRYWETLLLPERKRRYGMENPWLRKQLDENV